MIDVVLGLDLSINSTGYCLMDLAGGLRECGLITPDKYKNYTRDKYPKKTIKFIQTVISQIQDLVENCKHNVIAIVVEEINPGKGGMISTKSLSFLHGILLDRMIDIEDKISFLKTSEWRSKLKISAKGLKGIKDGIKIVTIEYVNDTYGLSFDMSKKGDNDLCDAICISAAYIKINNLDK